MPASHDSKTHEQNRRKQEVHTASVEEAAELSESGLGGGEVGDAARAPQTLSHSSSTRPYGRQRV